MSGLHKLGLPPSGRAESPLAPAPPSLVRQETHHGTGTAGTSSFFMPKPNQLRVTTRAGVVAVTARVWRTKARANMAALEPSGNGGRQADDDEIFTDPLNSPA